jgi:crotonobetainyl-CoA:carnitine CoA-transferase CaiB-like acyl-CoA transferase
VLDSLTVAELGDLVAVPYAGKVLADLGATVEKIELIDPATGRQGDTARQVGPFPAGQADPEHSGLFSYLNAGKRGRSLDLGSDGWRSDLAELLRGADVVLLDDTIRRALGEVADPQRLLGLDPATIVVAVTPFGLTGPYAELAGTDLVCSAAAGISVGVGEPDRPPLPLPYFQADFQAGMAAAIGALLGVCARDRIGTGQLVEISEHEFLASMHTTYFLPRYIYGGGVVGYRAGRVGNGTPYPDTILECKDGLVALNTPQVAQWIRFVTLMGTPEWSTQPRYRNRRAMQWEYKDEVDALVEPWLRQHPKTELVEAFLDHHLPYAPVQTGTELVGHPHLQAREAIAAHEFSAGDGAGFVAPQRPYLVDGVRTGRARGRAPRLGEHDRTSRPEPPTPPVPEPVPGGARTPLAGVRVLDLGTAWAGGLVGRILGDFGADVVKIESRSHMDGSRMGRPIVVDDEAGVEAGDEGRWPDMQPGFHVHGRNKRSVLLNLRAAEALEVLTPLLLASDALVHNFSPGVLDRLGLAESTLREINPRLVVVGQSVAGQTGPLRRYIGYNSTVSALAGLAALVGYEDEEPIGRFQGMYCDVVSALTAVTATLAGLQAAARTGQGCTVDVAQWEATMAIGPFPLLHASITGTDPGPPGATSVLHAPHGNYRCADEDSWVAVAVTGDPQWTVLCGLMGRPELATDPRFTTHADRRANRIDLDAAVTGWTSGLAATDAAARLQERGIAAFAVCDIESVYFDEQLTGRGAFTEVDQPYVGVEPMPGVPWRCARTPGGVRRRAPLLGEHTEEVLRGLGGLDEQRFAALVEAGVIER